MELIRIGEKVISRERLSQLISEILKKRSTGATQAEVAGFLGVERSFVSHLESLGEIRRGKQIALFGFPVKNKAEIEALAKDYGVDFVYLLSEEERLNLARQDGAKLFNQTLDVLAELKSFDIVLILASNMRIKTLEKILGKKVIGIPIGESPIKEDVYVKPDEINSVLAAAATRKRGKWRERGRKYKSWLLQKRPRSKS
ncbi:MAG: hypothetical protein Q8M92_07470 [Candidatus Subteraquimicrobiales bacterium]|nr:hypothetical protein [Candidatus Subteraquimicrobiales bacterium]